MDRFLLARFLDRPVYSLKVAEHLKSECPKCESKSRLKSSKNFISMIHFGAIEVAIRLRLDYV